VKVEPDSVVAPISPSPPLPQDVSKREHDLTDFDPLKRRKIGIRTVKQREIAQAERRKNLAERRRYARKYKAPIDQLALAQARREDDIKRRQKLKRKWQGPESVDRVRRVVRRPTGMSRSQRSGRIWMERLISAKSKEAERKRFKPTLW
uniref:SURF6 domain-containing protein n=1 Tax=Meloidogyne hapla TaxID=6305 RepID=A0A1I8BN02_MELHA